MKISIIKSHIIASATIIITACTPLQKEKTNNFTPHNPFGHALIPDMIADASITEFDGVFYCYATTDGYGRGLETSGPPTVWISKDFINWSFEENYFPDAADQKYWAPSKAIKANGKYYIYPTINGYMYPAVSNTPNGPFKLVKGEGFITKNRLWEKDNVHAIDTEIFIDDDGQIYAFWGSRNVAKLQNNMATIDTIYRIETRRKEYSEGPIFFKRKGIYYYLYTIGGDENYEYYYQMSKESPLGPWTTPMNDLVSTTNIQTGVFGPGHGSVFHVEGTDDYYLAYLEFGRNSTNRQTYVNKLEFNEDGTIQQVKVDMKGVGALRQVATATPLKITSCFASSSQAPLKIRYFNDSRCQRTEFFNPSFAFDNANGSRWMAAEGDTLQTWLIADLGTIKQVKRSELYFVRPTAGHAYTLEGSIDGIQWEKCGGHKEIEKRSPHTDILNKEYRYLRTSIQQGIAGVWEWKLY